MNNTCDLTDRHCKPCEGGIAPLSRSEASDLLAEVPGWALDEDGKSIHRRFEFSDFHACMVFINGLAGVANTEDHHPDFCAGYSYCNVTFNTHAIGGLSENDFICAAKVNAVPA